MSVPREVLRVQGQNIPLSSKSPHFSRRGSLTHSSNKAVKQKFLVRCSSGVGEQTRMWAPQSWGGLEKKAKLFPGEVRMQE